MNKPHVAMIGPDGKIVCDAPEVLEELAKEMGVSVDDLPRIIIGMAKRDHMMQYLEPFVKSLVDGMNTDRELFIAMMGAMARDFIAEKGDKGLDKMLDVSAALKKVVEAMDLAILQSKPSKGGDH